MDKTSTIPFYKKGVILVKNFKFLCLTILFITIVAIAVWAFVDSGNSPREVNFHSPSEKNLRYKESHEKHGL